MLLYLFPLSIYLRDIIQGKMDAETPQTIKGQCPVERKILPIGCHNPCSMGHQSLHWLYHYFWCMKLKLLGNSLSLNRASTGHVSLPFFYMCQIQPPSLHAICRVVLGYMFCVILPEIHRCILSNVAMTLAK